MSATNFTNPTNAQLQKAADENAHAWLDANTDTNGLSERDRLYVEKLKGPKKVSKEFDLMDTSMERSKITDNDFTEADLEQLAKKDPNGFGVQWRENKMEQVTNEFKRANPTYLPVERNYDAMLGHIKKWQLQDEGLPEDDVMESAFDKGYWTAENLSGIFKILANKGQLQMPKGQPKPLTRDEQLDCLILVRQGNYRDAITQYIAFAFGGVIPQEHTDYRQFMKDHPALAQQALEFTFFHAKATISPTEWKAFKQAKLVGCPMLNWDIITANWDEWKESNQFARYTAKTETAKPKPSPTPIDPNKLSDADLDAAIVEERKNYRKSR